MEAIIKTAPVVLGDILLLSDAPATVLECARQGNHFNAGDEGKYLIPLAQTFYGHRAPTNKSPRNQQAAGAFRFHLGRRAINRGFPRQSLALGQTHHHQQHRLQERPAQQVLQLFPPRCGVPR